MLSFSAKFAYDLIEFAAQQGADKNGLLKITGVSPQMLSREDIRIPSEQMAKIWAQAQLETDEPFLALRMGMQQYSAQQTTNLIMGNSLTVREAFGEAIKYGELIANVMTVSLEQDADQLALRFTLKPEWENEDPTVTLDCLLIALMSASRAIGGMLGVHEPPHKILLSSTDALDRTLLYECFDCAVEIGASINAAIFSERVLNREIQQPNLSLREAIKSYADTICDNLVPHLSLSDQVTRILTLALPQRIGQQRTADQLNMSMRTLQRKLTEEGVQFRQLAENVSMACAQHHLTTTSLSLDEIAFLSGYSDAPGLIRAYKRHFGKLPQRA